MDVDTFKKHVKEVRGMPTVLAYMAEMVYSSHISHHCGEEEK